MLKKTWFILAGLIAVSVSTACLLVVINLHYGWQSAGPAAPFASAEYYDPYTHSGGDNVSGWAWNSNIGWISFNSVDCDVDGDGAYEGANEGNGPLFPGDADGDHPAPADCPTSGGVSDYGVKTDLTAANLGNFSGYAWSSNLGWISFQGNALDYDFNSSCETVTCTAANNCTACYNYSDQQVYGWAQILSLGDDGWIKLNDGSWTGMTIDPATSETTGWAWNGNDTPNIGISWISFSSDNPGSGGGDYEVIANVNTVPMAANLTAPNWNQANACPNVPLAAGYRQARGAVLTWDFVDPDPGSFGSAYQVVVRERGGSAIINTCKCNGQNSCYGGGSDNDCRISLNCMAMDGGRCYYRLDASELEYDTAYEWEITVWDDYNVSSTTIYNVSADTGVVPGTDDGDPHTFTTYAHEFPDPSFGWFMPDPSAREEVRFDDTTEFRSYGTPDADNAGTCVAGEDNCDWDWQPSGGSLTSSNGEPTALISFDSAGNWSVGLTVTDREGYFCSTSTSMSSGGGVEVKESLPGWQEVK